MDQARAPQAAMCLDSLAQEGHPEKVTNYFLFDRLYATEYQETMMTVASNSKLS